MSEALGAECLLLERQAASIGDSTKSRDGRGRFLTGNIGGGRPKGSRNRLTDVVLGTILTDFKNHGSEALVKLREANPEAYLRLVCFLVPREMILQRERTPDLSELSDEEFAEMLSEARRTKIFSQIYNSCIE